MPLEPRVLRSLAPDLPPGKPQGDPIAAATSVRLAALPPEDRPLLRALYRGLTELYATLRDDLTRGEVAPRTDALLAERGEALLPDLAPLGRTLSEPPSPEVAKALHDVRSGSLAALSMLLELRREGLGERGDVDRMFVLARDHLKILRSCLPDLDPEGTAADLVENRHDVALLREKWSGVDYAVDGTAPVRVHFRCDFEGSVSECCMEFAALDRVLYNLVNNAGRFAADGTVGVDVLPLEEAGTTVLRFAVSNPVSPEHGRRLRERFACAERCDLRTLFLGGFTTGGHGHGLRICTDLVTHGFALPSAEAAVDAGYVGATLLEDTFVAWFHWPGERREAT